jgi:hypothetical protein
LLSAEESPLVLPVCSSQPMVNREPDKWLTEDGNMRGNIGDESGFTGVAGDLDVERELIDEHIRNMRSPNAEIAMSCAEAVEVASRNDPSILGPYEPDLIELAGTANLRELQWRIVVMIERLPFGRSSRAEAFDALQLMFRRTKSRGIRAALLDAIIHVSMPDDDLRPKAFETLDEALASEVPSMSARARKLVRELRKKSVKQ